MLVTDVTVSGLEESRDCASIVWAPNLLLGHLKKDFVTKERARTGTFKWSRPLHIPTSLHVLTTVRPTGLAITPLLPAKFATYLAVITIIHPEYSSVLAKTCGTVFSCLEVLHTGCDVLVKTIRGSHCITIQKLISPRKDHCLIYRGRISRRQPRQMLWLLQPLLWCPFSLNLAYSDGIIIMPYPFHLLPWCPPLSMSDFIYRQQGLY